MIASDALAAALLSHVEDEKVADVLFNSVKFNANPVKMRTFLSDQAVRSSLKAEWSKTATAATATQSSELLAKLAKDSRRGVRRVVAGNENTPPEALEYLYTWAMDKQDQETLFALIKKVDVGHVVRSLEGRKFSWDFLRSFPFVPLAQRLAELPDKTQVLAAVAANTTVASRLAELSLRGKVSSVTLTELFGALDLEAQKTVAHECLSERNLPLTAELARLLVNNKGWDLGERTSSLPATCGTVTHPVDPDACRILVPNGTPLWRTLVASSSQKLPDEVVDDLIDNGPLEVVEALVREHPTQMSGDRVERVVSSWSERLSIEANCLLMETSPGPLSTLGVVNLLCATGWRATGSWLLGTATHTPQPGEVSLVLADARPWLPTGIRSTAQTSETSPVEILRQVDRAADSLYEKPWADEFVDKLGSAWVETFPTWSSFQNHRVAYLADRFAREFQGNPAMWQTAIQFFPTWESSLSELIDLVRIVNQVGDDASLEETDVSQETPVSACEPGQLF